MAWHPELLAGCRRQGLVVFESTGVRAFFHVGNAVGHGDVADRRDFVLHHLHTQVSGRVRCAVVMQAQTHITEGHDLAVPYGGVGQDQFGAQGGLVGPAFQQAAPEIGLGALKFVDGALQGINRQFVTVAFDKCVVTQPMVAMVVAVENRHHGLLAQLADHADRHLANLQRSARVQHHHPDGGEHENHVGHHAAVLRRRKSIRRENHPHMRRQLPGCDVGHRRAFNEVMRLLRQQPGIGPQGCAAQCGAAEQ